MPKLFYLDASHAADPILGSNFDGTEFAAQAKSGYRLRIREIRIKMGAEAKTWQLQKRFTPAGGTQIASIHLQSVDALGAPAATTATDVVINGEDAALIDLLPGEQLQLVTAGASSAQHCRITYEEVPNDTAPRATDSNVTR